MIKKKLLLLFSICTVLVVTMLPFIACGTPAPDPTGMTVGAVTSKTNRGGTINWTTTRAGTTQVEYGATAAYGSETDAIDVSVLTHAVSLDGLAANTTYHYRVKTTVPGATVADEDESLVSPDKTFKTGAAVTYKIGNTTQPSTDNPFAATIGAGNASHSTLMYEPLVWVRFDGGTGAALATSWTYNETTMKWTITLNPDAKFSNGEQVTAGDVKFSLEKYMALGLPQTNNLQPALKQIDGATADGIAIEIKANGTAAVTLERTAGSFVTDGFNAGELVRLTGTADGDDKGTTGDQDGSYLIDSVAALVLTLDPTVNLADEAPNTGLSLAAVGPIADAITVVDDTTLTMELESFYATFMRFLGDAVIVPESVWGDMTNVEVMAYTNADPVGSGPFMLRERESSSHVIYDANLDYWGGAPNVDVVQKLFFDNEEAQLLAIKLGNVDAVSNFNLPTAIPQLVGIPEVDIFQIADNTTMTFYVNHRFEPWDDPDVRNAVSIGLDRQNLITFAANNWGNLPVMLERDATFPDVIAGAVWPYEGNTQVERLAMANEALDEITGMSQTPAAVEGVVPAFVRTFNGDPLAFTLEVATWTEHTTVGELLVEDLADMGFEMDLKPLNVTALVTKTFRQKSEATLDGWQTYVWGRPFPPEYDYFADQWAYDLIPNFANRSTVMGWLDAASQAIGPKLDELQTLPEGNATRTALIAETQQLWVDELPALPLYHSINPGVHRNDKFTGWIEDNGLIAFGAVTAMASIYNIMNLEPI